MNVVSVPDVASLLLMTVDVFMPFIKISFSIMTAFYISHNIKNLVVG